MHTHLLIHTRTRTHPAQYCDILYPVAAGEDEQKGAQGEGEGGADAGASAETDDVAAALAKEIEEEKVRDGDCTGRVVCAW